MGMLCFGRLSVFCVAVFFGLHGVLTFIEWCIVIGFIFRLRKTGRWYFVNFLIFVGYIVLLGGIVLYIHFVLHCTRVKWHCGLVLYCLSYFGLCGARGEKFGVVG